MIKLNKVKKFYKSIDRKWLKPLAYTILISMMIYLIIGNLIIRKYNFSSSKPHFVISTISDKFEYTEYMHMLLTIQEINSTVLKEDLKNFVNSPFPAECPKYLKKQLYNMNWDANAFQIRAQNLIKIYNIYDHIVRLEETIEMLNQESKSSIQVQILFEQIRSLTTEKNRIIKNQLTPNEYEFIKEYSGIVPSLQLIEEK